MREGDGDIFEMFKEKPFQTALNKTRTSREVGRDKDKSSAFVLFYFFL